MDDDFVLDISQSGEGHDPKDPLSLVSCSNSHARPRLLTWPTVHVFRELINDAQWCKFLIIRMFLLFTQ
jgi:hypothetical protein